METKTDIIRKKYNAGTITADEYLSQRYKIDYGKGEKKKIYETREK